MTTPYVRTICVTRAGQEEVLCSELRSRPHPLQCTRVCERVVEISSRSYEELVELPLFFSAQALPNAQDISAESINRWAGAIFTYLVEKLGDSQLPWSLHIFDPLSAETGKAYTRPTRIYEAVISLLKQKRRTLLTLLQEVTQTDSNLVQVLTVSPTHGYISIASPQVREALGSALSPHQAGFVDLPDDKQPPSRAFKKLREAITRFGLSIHKGETAVDLGASPGGWTFVLREHGASVTAIDRSPLAPALMRDRNVNFIQGNALTWTPPTQVDWLVCDVITTPANTVATLKLWISKNLCRNFCVTVKFKGEPEIEALISIARFLRENTAWCDGKQLTHNKNEVTVVGMKKGPLPRG